jgi:hypothetical protein
MNYIVSTSRGRKLQTSLTNATTGMCVLPGAKLTTLLATAKTVIRTSNTKGNKPGHMYFLAGVPDLTTKLRGPNYQEVIFMGSPPDTVPGYEEQLTKASQDIKVLGWKPVFCPIIPMALKDWNAPCRTSYLIHYHHYEDMQALLEKTIIAINHIIQAINKSNRVHTPNIQSNIIKMDHGRTKFMYNRLLDGCHPNDAAADKWVQILEQSISINDSRGITPIIPETRLSIRTTKSQCQSLSQSSDEDDSDTDKIHKRQW